MDIGSNIRKLRRERDITQEQLAEFLNISVSAISQWECGKTTPDISLLAPLANVFEVTSDALLGIDITVKENRIKDIVNQAQKAQQYGSVDYEKAIEILRAGLKEYPNSYEIMAELMSCIRTIRFLGKGKEDDEAVVLLNEVINLGEKILAECTNDSCRYKAIHELCPAYSDPVIGKTDKAMELAEKVPHYHKGREFLLESIYQGDKKLKKMQQNIGQCFVTIISIMSNYIHLIFRNDEKGSLYNDYTAEDGIALCRKFITLIEVMFENGDYGSYGQFMAGMSTTMAKFYIELDNFESAIRALHLSAEYAIKFDTEHKQNKPKSSLLFKNTMIGYIVINTKDNAAMFQLELMKQTAFDPIRERKEFIEIEEKLNSLSVQK